MRRVMAILDPDAEYGKRLAAFFNEQGSIGFRATSFSDLSSLQEFRRTAHVEILLITEELAAEAHGMTEGSKVILLSSDGFVSSGEKKPFGAPAVFKFQPADRIAREIMKAYADDEGCGTERAKAGQCEILGVYSPVNRCGKTTLALTLGFARASRGKTLLLTLEEFAGIFGSISREAESDLSDVVYCFLQGNYSWSRLKSHVYSFGPLDYIPPVRCMEDVSQISSEDMAHLIRRIAEESGYSTVIIDFGSFGRRALELLDICGRIFMPAAEDPASELKLASFYEYLEKAGKAELKDKIVRCRLPWEKEKEHDYAAGLISVFESGALYEYAAGLH